MLGWPLSAFLTARSINEGFGNMRTCKRVVCYGATIVVALSVAVAQADVFNMADGQTSLSFVPVGDAGNPAGSGDRPRLGRLRLSDGDV